MVYCQFNKTLSQKTLKHTELIWHNLQNTAPGGDGQNAAPSTITLPNCKNSTKSEAPNASLPPLRHFFNYLEYEEILESTPFAKLRIRLNEPFVLPRTIPIDMIEIRLRSAYAEKDKCMKNGSQWRERCRDLAVLELLFASGVRISELCSLTTDSIDLQDGRIRLYGKGSRERILQIGNAEVMSAYLDEITTYPEVLTFWDETGCGGDGRNASNYCTFSPPHPARE